jgi:hypothetical protein
MPPAQPARLLRIHISEYDRWQGRALYEVLVDKCREMRIAGATVFRGLEGYGETAEMHRAGIVHNDRPIVIVIVDAAERIASLISAVGPMIDTGVMALSDVQAVRIAKSA